MHSRNGFRQRGWFIGFGLLLMVALRTPAAAFDNDIHLLAAPPVTADGTGGFSFVVFGDTRTPQSDEAAEDLAFHRLRNLTHQAVRDDLEQNGFSFALSTGDLVHRGSNPENWREIREQFPAGLRSVSGPRLFPVLGNHELWQQEGEGDALGNFYATFPYLAEDGTRFHNYAFRVGNSLFIGLCSGSYGSDPAHFKQDDRTWTCRVVESFDGLMASLRSMYRQQSLLGKGIDHLFVVYHKPSYTLGSHPPLAAGNDPLEVLRTFKHDDPDLKIYVFNGHNHVTELFRPEPGVYALVAGGGGAPQRAGLSDRDHGKPEAELFWPAAGSARHRRLNYFRVAVGGDGSVSLAERVLRADGATGAIGYGKGVVMAGEELSVQGADPGSSRLDDYIHRFSGAGQP